jgi:predicted nucleic acid-binding protein
MRVFMDANVLFAASISSEGRSAALFELAQRGACELLTSAHAATEVRRNLEGRYPEALGRFEQLTLLVTIVREAPSPQVSWATRQGLPDEDAPILAAAAAAAADVLVTGDRSHLGNLFGLTLERVRVLALADTLALLAGQRGQK